MAVDFFNLLLGSGPASDEFWADTLIPTAEEMFGVPIERDVPPALLLAAVSDATGFTFHDTDEYDFTQSAPLSLAKLVDVRPRTHCPPIVNDVTLLLGGNPARMAPSEAKQRLNLALDVAGRRHGVTSSLLAPIFAQLAVLHVRSGEHHAAGLYARAALGLGRKFHGTSVLAYSALIPAAFSAGDTELGSMAFKHGMRVGQWLGGASLALVHVQAGMSLGYTIIGSPHQAIEHRARAADMATRLLGTKHVFVAGQHQAAADLHWSLGGADQRVEAVNLQVAALRVFMVAEPTSPRTADCLVKLATMNKAMGRPGEAVANLTAALKIHRDVGTGGTEAEDILWAIAEAAEDDGDVSLAVEALEELHGLVRGGDDMERVQDVIKRVLRVRLNHTTAEERSVLTRIAEQRHMVTDEGVMGEVIGELLDNPPGQYLDQLLRRAVEMDAEAYDRVVTIHQLVTLDEILIDKGKEVVEEPDLGMGAGMDSPW